MGLPQLLAGLDVKERQDKENCGERQHEQILHCKSPKVFAAQAGTMQGEHAAALTLRFILDAG